MDSLAQPKYRKMGMRFGTWDARSLYKGKGKAVSQHTYGGAGGDV
jgi:hypothetical protein